MIVCKLGSHCLLPNSVFLGVFGLGVGLTSPPSSLSFHRFSGEGNAVLHVEDLCLGGKGPLLCASRLDDLTAAVLEV